MCHRNITIWKEYSFTGFLRGSDATTHNSLYKTNLVSRLPHTHGSLRQPKCFQSLNPTLLDLSDAFSASDASSTTNLFKLIYLPTIPPRFLPSTISGTTVKPRQQTNPAILRQEEFQWSRSSKITCHEYLSYCLIEQHAISEIKPQFYKIQCSHQQLYLFHQASAVKDTRLPPFGEIRSSARWTKFTWIELASEK